MKKNRVYLLSDGKEWTAQEAALKSNVPLATMRCRLGRTDDIDKILAPRRVQGKGWAKVYTLSDNTEWTVEQIVQNTGATHCCIGGRLFRSNEVSRVLATVRNPKKETYTQLRDNVKRRMFFEGRDEWVLLGRCT